MLRIMIPGICLGMFMRIWGGFFLRVQADTKNCKIGSITKQGHKGVLLTPSLLTDIP